MSQEKFSRSRSSAISDRISRNVEKLPLKATLNRLKFFGALILYAKKRHDRKIIK